MDCVLEAGYTKPLASVALPEKEDIVVAITTFHLFLKV